MAWDRRIPAQEGSGSGVAMPGSHHASVQHYAGVDRRLGIARLRHRSFGSIHRGKELIGLHLAAGRGLDPRCQFPRWSIDPSSNARNRASINSNAITKAGVVEAVLCHPV
jgi:hypothetical protein